MRPLTCCVCTLTRPCPVLLRDLSNGDYRSIAHTFESYGSFVNFCVEHGITTTPLQRRGVIGATAVRHTALANDGSCRGGKRLTVGNSEFLCRAQK